MTQNSLAQPSCPNRPVGKSTKLFQTGWLKIELTNQREGVLSSGSSENCRNTDLITYAQHRDTPLSPVANNTKPRTRQQSRAVSDTHAATESSMKKALKNDIITDFSLKPVPCHFLWEFRRGRAPRFGETAIWSGTARRDCKVSQPSNLSVR
ncbi:hypothetical protein BaRGS_00013609 [Batillaria attramentaria]|uniref:Uncharacterized protein n=1 Tax=Batillaria attramentaria TaxID=370345 RepID=A0ABD0L771_9CAEN